MVDLVQKIRFTLSTSEPSLSTFMKMEAKVIVVIGHTTIFVVLIWSSNFLPVLPILVQIPALTSN